MRNAIFTISVALGLAGFGFGFYVLATDAFPMTETEQREMLSGAEVAACAFEDQVPDVNPCYWDSELQGNGQGRSYVAFPDGSLLFD